MDRVAVIAAGEVFDFDLRDGMVSVNVKCHAQVKIPEGRRKKLDLLEWREPGITERFQEWAWENITDSWWRDRSQEAADKGFGKVVATGRSGGYLTLTAYTKETLATLVRGVERECKGCGMPYKEHPGGKCLFDAGSFETTNTVDLDRLRGLTAWVEEVKSNVNKEHIEQQLEEAMAYYIDEAR